MHPQIPAPNDATTTSFSLRLLCVPLSAPNLPPLPSFPFRKQSPASPTKAPVSPRPSSTAPSPRKRRPCPRRPPPPPRRSRDRGDLRRLARARPLPLRPPRPLPPHQSGAEARPRRTSCEEDPYKQHPRDRYVEHAKRRPSIPHRIAIRRRFAPKKRDWAGKA